MKVEELKNYGKDLLSIQEQSQMSLRDNLRLLAPVLGYLWGVLKTLGLSGTIRLAKNVREEIQRAETHDWARLKAKGISQEHLDGIIAKIALAKGMAEMRCSFQPCVPRLGSSLSARAHWHRERLCAISGSLAFRRGMV